MGLRLGSVISRPVSKLPQILCTRVGEIFYESLARAGRVDTPGILMNGLQSILDQRYR